MSPFFVHILAHPIAIIYTTYSGDVLLGRHLQARVVVFPSESYYTLYMSVVRPESQLSRPLTGRGNGSYRDNYLTHSHLTVTEFEIFYWY